MKIYSEKPGKYRLSGVTAIFPASTPQREVAVTPLHPHRAAKLLPCARPHETPTGHV